MNIDEPLNNSGGDTRDPLEGLRMISSPGEGANSDRPETASESEPLPEAELLERIESTAKRYGAQQELFTDPAISAPEVFVTFSPQLQSVVIEVGLQARKYKSVKGLLEYAQYDPKDQMQRQLLYALEEQRFFTARQLASEFTISFSDQARASLLQSVENVAASVPWRKREAITDLIALADPGSWEHLAETQKEKLVAVGISVEKIEKAHLIGTMLGLSDDSMRAVTVQACLEAGRIELAVQLGDYFGLPLKDSEITAVTENLKARLGLNGQLVKNGRVISILAAYLANGALNVDDLPELAGNRDAGLVTALVLFAFRGRTVAHFGTAEDGHPGAFDDFRAHLVNNGFAGEPTVLGGTLAFFTEGKKVIIQGASSTYGACDREHVGEILRRALPDYSVEVRHDFPEIPNRS